MSELTTQEQLLQSAYELFIGKGYHGTSMRDIARHTGLAVSSIYNHFSDKETLFISLMQTRHPFVQLFPKLSDLDKTSTQALLRESIALVVELYHEQPAIFSLLFIEAIEFDNRHLPQLFDAMQGHVEQFVSRLQAVEGDLNTQSPTIIFQWLMTVMFACFANDKLTQHTMEKDAHKALLQNLYINGMLKE